MARLQDPDYPYGPDNRFANSLNRAWNYNRNPLYQYYRFPFESLFASPPRSQMWWRVLIALVLTASPLLGSIPSVWTLCKVDAVALLICFVYGGYAPKNQTPLRNAALVAVVILGVGLAALAIGTFSRFSGFIV